MSPKKQGRSFGEWAPDEIDVKILDCYRQDPECPMSRIANEVGRRESAVRERVKRLRDSGVLSFVAVIDYDRVSTHAIEAYVEVTFPGDADVHESLRELVYEIDRPEIRDAITLIGDVDAMIRVRTKDVATLRDLVTQIRGNQRVKGTRTRIVAGNQWYGATRDASDGAASSSATS